jgi:hypothetical protein
MGFLSGLKDLCKETASLGAELGGTAAQYASPDGICELAETVTEKALTPIVGEDAAEFLGDAAGFGVAYATGNHYQMAMQACDALGVEDELPGFVKAGAALALGHGQMPAGLGGAQQYLAPASSGSAGATLMKSALGDKVEAAIKGKLEGALAGLVGAERAETLVDLGSAGAHWAMGDKKAAFNDAMDAAEADDWMPPWMRDQVEQQMFRHGSGMTNDDFIRLADAREEVELA